MEECGKDVFPDFPQWDVKCNLEKGHEEDGTPCARLVVHEDDLKEPPAESPIGE